MTNNDLKWQIAEEAADWVVQIDSGPLSPESQARFAEWAKRSPTHVEELLCCASLLVGLKHIDITQTNSAANLLLAANRENVHYLHGGGMEVEADLSEPDQYQPIDQRLGGRNVWRLSALAASISLIFLFSWFITKTDYPPINNISEEIYDTYQTTSSGQQSIKLEDGSILRLNSESQVRILFSDSERVVELSNGEALFDVAYDPDRPFRVLSSGKAIQAVGTKFTVKTEGGNINVVVIEGKVIVGNIESILLYNSEANDLFEVVSAGREAYFPISGLVNISDADVVTEIAWQARYMTFDNEPLSMIAAQFNRNNALEIVIDHSDLMQTRMSGIFDVHDPESFIAFLKVTGEVTVERSGRGRVVVGLSQ